MTMRYILKVLVGSRAHHLHTETSDFDYRGVFQVPTSEILKLGGSVQQTSWIEGTEPAAGSTKVDATGWELGHFLHLATHCNPTILEVFAAPRVYQGLEWSVLDWSSWGTDLRGLFRYIWNPKGVRDAFIGYGLNQRKKFLEDKDTRPAKYAVAYLRVLYQAEVLLTTGVLPVDMRGTPVYNALSVWRVGDYTKGQVVDLCLKWQRRVEDAYAECKQVPDLDRVNDWLLSARREYWTA